MYIYIYIYYIYIHNQYVHIVLSLSYYHHYPYHYWRPCRSSRPCPATWRCAPRPTTPTTYYYYYYYYYLLLLPTTTTTTTTTIIIYIIAIYKYMIHHDVIISINTPSALFGERWITGFGLLRGLTCFLENSLGLCFLLLCVVGLLVCCDCLEMLVGWCFNARERKVKPFRASQSLSETFSVIFS